MSQRPEIPDGEHYRDRSDLSSECATLMLDLISRDFVMRTVGAGKNAISFAFSEVYEPVMETLSCNSKFSPAIRIRRELSERVEQPIVSGQFVSTDSVSADAVLYELQAYTLELGEELDELEQQPKTNFDNHDMYSWTPLLTAVIEKRKVASDFQDFTDGDFEEVTSSIVYTESGIKPDDVELLRMIHLLQSIQHTAREYAVYEPSIIPHSTRLQQFGKMTARNFGALDAVSPPCSVCIRTDIPCVHGTSDN